jgi:putative ABC transport system permease protein
MGRLLRTIRRAPARILVSVLALALAVAAMGVFAIPTVATSSLRDEAEVDRLAHVAMTVSDTGVTDVVGDVAVVDGVVDVAGQVVAPVQTSSGSTLTVVGSEAGTVDTVTVDSGRLPATADEIVAPSGALGDAVAVAGPDGRAATLTVVGIGGTSYWSGEEAVFALPETARALAGVEGWNRLAVRADDTDAASLDRLTQRLVDHLADEGIAPTSLPVTVPGGQHPIEDDIAQVSTLIGFLGIVAGVVALVLLGSTTTTLVTERSREVAVMRALGASPRRLRRRLRSLAVGIAAAALVVGLPLGIAVSNVIARMVLQEFVGLTPGIAVSVPVLVGSVVFALLGARLVSAGAARRVVGKPLATALRDREGLPFGRRLGERLAARVPAGGLLDRIALRNGVHRRSRILAVFAQVTAAVAALMIVASLATTVNAFNSSETEPWNWTTRTTLAGPGLDIDAARMAAPGVEAAVDVEGVVDGWEVQVVGLRRDTAMLDTAVTAGRWLGDEGDAVVSEGFAVRTGIEIGDRLPVRVASGETTVDVVGLHRAPGRYVFVDVDELAATLGAPGQANVVLAGPDAAAPVLPGPSATVHADDVTEEEAAREAILLVFGAIGAVVVAVAGLAVASGLAVSVHERRHEFAALRALGARRREVMRVVAAEVAPVAAAGIVAGLALGHGGARAIIASFEADDAVEIGFTYAAGAIPAVVAVVVVGCLLVIAAMVRQVARRPVAETLRGAA